VNPLVPYKAVVSGLTKKQKKLIKTIAESKTPLNISEACEKAKVTRQVWYTLIENPSMGTLLPETLNYLMAHRLIPIVNKVAQRAEEGSAAHAVIALRMVHLLEDREPNPTKIIQIFGREGTDRDVILTTQQIAQMIKESKGGPTDED
jgi:hypothetical protein